MRNLSVNIVNLSDEILLYIFKMINNFELLYSIVGINQRLDKIACDISITHSLDLTHISLNDRSNSRTNEILDRFSMEILPQISHKIEFLAVQSSIFHRIFRSHNYPNLCKLTLDNVKLDMASQIFNSMLPNSIRRSFSIIQKFFSFVYVQKDHRSFVYINTKFHIWS